MLILTDDEKIIQQHTKDTIDIKKESRELLGKIIDLSNKFDTIDDILLHINTDTFIIVDRITLSTILNTFSYDERLKLLRKSTIRYICSKYKYSNKEYYVLITRKEISQYCNINIDGVKKVFKQIKQSNNKRIKLRR